MHRTPLAIGMCLPLLVAGPSAAEPPATANLHYLRDNSAANCPDEETLRRGVAARLGRQPFADGSEKSIFVRLQATTQGYAVAISVHAANGDLVGERALQSAYEDCSELAEAMQLAIAIAIDPLYSASAVDSPASVPAEPSAMPIASIAVETPGGSHQPRSHHLGVGLALSASTEAYPGAGLNLQYKNVGEHTAWGVELRADLPNEFSARTGRVRTSLAAASALVCLQGHLVSPCAVASVGFLRGSGQQFDQVFTVSTPYAAGGARVSKLFAVNNRFGIEAVADLLARLTTTTLFVDDEEVWMSGPLEFAIGVRALWSLE